MPQRGGERFGLWHDGRGALLAVARHDWECAPGFSENLLVTHEDGCVVAADASVYYRADLERQLGAAGVRAASTAPSHLILAAYRAWGDACVERIEGDFAFVLWDAGRRRVLCSRDFAGKRPLYYAMLGDTLVVASTIAAVLAHPACPADFNLASLAETASGLLAAGHETCYRAVQRLLPGFLLTWQDGHLATPVRCWHPPLFNEPRGVASFDDAAEQLRAVIASAIVERLVPQGPTSIWMSGGWDSPSLFGIGQDALRQDTERTLRPVSISYPPGDTAREDELIQSIAQHWNAPIQWVDSREMPLLDHAAERACARDDPFAHVYESTMRWLSRGSRAVGSHVALDGNGGDQWFSVTEVFLADCLRRGRWMTLAHEWRAKNGSGFRPFFRWAVQPVLPPLLLGMARLLRGGRPLVGYLERTPPEWIEPEFVERYGILERERRFTPHRGRMSHATFEQWWYLTNPFFPRVVGTATSAALEEGVELRSPLYDRRVIELAATRPRAERSSGLETKRLLRRAARGLLPDHVLSPRPYRTGLTTTYLYQSFRRQAPELFTSIFSRSILAEMGIVNLEVLRMSLEQQLRGTHDHAVPLFWTLQVELWLRARMPTASVVSTPRSEPVTLLAAG
ncbi:MAG TPA: asparagine synthase-related protein [Gemmatimonadaceae bacterium]|nr:asparagine synthase-related protein [Gemmatimonadaceae bacterium]